MSTKVYYFTAVCLFLVSCSGLDRSYLRQMSFEDGIFIPRIDYPIVSGDDYSFRSKQEIIARTPSSQYDERLRRYENSLSIELRDLESELGDGEREEYQDSHVFFRSISDKIYFLNLSNKERGEYLDIVRGRVRKNKSKNVYSSKNSDKEIKWQWLRR